MSKYHTADNLYVDNVTLMVKDIDKSLKFYTESLGLTLLNNKSNIYELGTKKRVLVILIHNENALPKERTTGLYHFALLLPDRRFLGQLINHFIVINQKIVGGSDHDVSEALYLSDPDGNGIEIYADRLDTLWKYENDEIVMSTEAMDYEDLIKHAYNAKWTEMPEDTVMGHVHFHVTSLINAGNFFIDTLGFNQMLYYGTSALFLSNKGYHHHVGLNTWNGVTAKNRADNMVGLVGYHLNVPKDEEEALLERISFSKREILNDENGRYIVDVNKVKIYF
ncbi:VOC family protein [Haploplasma axanthum]|uniref:Catechol-2,3-dioxygenase n=1 Tax=Haploplasma axanthum TaxID=29552 RepID=A0A449BBU0_HAPAX|nr:VOC family protein [Haploplasma axanthum]VEU79725.1 Catechol-2,3-dioxygenase [Haploplasma axanthum]